MLLQVDGSRHDWLEGRGPYLTLVGGVDDATGTVPYALFREQEDTQGYFLLLREVIRRQGTPLALYSDRHSVFSVNSKQPLTLDEELAGERQPTQFGRALTELGIQCIFAHSPQAKGRIERLWGTFQDRLVVELRLAGATTLAEANQVLGTFLPRFNARFAVPPAQPGLAYRQPPSTLDLESILCFHYERRVAADNTVRFADQTLQLLPGLDRVSYARAQVQVQERLDGSLVVRYQGKTLATRPAPPATPVLRARQRSAPSPTPALLQEAPPVQPARPRPSNGARPHIPAPDHPWRKPWALTKSLTS
jgi:hypothetical protein